METEEIYDLLTDLNGVGLKTHYGYIINFRATHDTVTINRKYLVNGTWQEVYESLIECFNVAPIIIPKRGDVESLMKSIEGRLTQNHILIVDCIDRKTYNNVTFKVWEMESKIPNKYLIKVPNMPGIRLAELIKEKFSGSRKGMFPDYKTQLSIGVGATGL